MQVSSLAGTSGGRYALLDNGRVDTGANEACHAVPGPFSYKETVDMGAPVFCILCDYYARSLPSCNYGCVGGRAL